MDLTTFFKIRVRFRPYQPDSDPQLCLTGLIRKIYTASILFLVMVDQNILCACEVRNR